MVLSNQIISFKLSGINYTGTSTQLNYTSGVLQGEALASKALILDANKSATGLGQLTMTALTATNVTGTLQTAAQPNITSLGNLSNLIVNGSINMNSMVINGVTVNATGNDLNLLTGVTAGVVTASKAVIANSSRNLTNINLISTVDITSTGAFTYKGTAITADGSKINYIDTTPGTAAASKALVLDASRDISNIRNLSAASVTGTTITGVLQTASQPNVTSIGTLTSLNLAGPITGVSDISLSGTLTSVNVTATSVTGTLQTASQPNITSVGTLSSLNVNGSCTFNSVTLSSLTIGGTLIDASGSDINRLSGATAGTAAASKCVVLDNLRSVGNIQTLTAVSLTATNITGTIQTGSQPNVTALGTLSSLNVSNTVNVNYLNNSATFASYFSATNPMPGGSISGRFEINNVSARLGTTTEHPFRLMSNGNINMSLDTNGNVSIGTQTVSAYKLNVAGALNTSSMAINNVNVNATAHEMNYLASATAGTGVASKCVVLDTNRNIGNINELTVASLITGNLEGTLQTASQPNITSIGTLSSLTISSSGNCLTLQNTQSAGVASFRMTNNLRTVEVGLAGNGAVSNANLLYISDSSATRLVLDASGNITIGGNVNPNAYKLNVIGSLNASSIALNGVAVSGTAAELNTLAGVTAGSASASKAIVLDSSRDITNIRNLTATALAGTLQTSNQPNVTSLGVLTSLALSGAVTGVTDITATGTISSLNVNASNISGTVMTATQPNITSVGTLNNVVIGSNAKIGTTSSAAADMLHIEGNNINGLGMQIENRNTTSNSMSYVKFTGYNASNDNYDLASIGCGYVTANANYGYGYLVFATRNNSSSSTATERMRITEAGNVGIMKSVPLYTLDVDGAVNATELRIGGTLIAATAVELSRLGSVTPGTAAASKAVVLDSSRDIANIRNLTATNLSGSIQTASQTAITELGTLTSLAVNGAVNLTGAVTINGNSNFSNKDVLGIASLTATNITGTLQTASQPNVTSLGILTSIGCSGSSKIGVTTNAAQDILHVEGSSSNTVGIQLDNTSTVANSGTHIKFNGYNISNNNYDIARITCGYVAANASYGYGYLAFSTRNVSANSAASERMRITESGSVGIGTSNPSYTLDVNGTTKVNRLMVNSTDTGRLVSILNSNIVNNAEEFITFGKSNSLYNQAEITYNHLSDGSDSNTLRFGFYGSARRTMMRANGYMAVNMVAQFVPGYPLHINQGGSGAGVCISYDSGNVTTGCLIGCTSNGKTWFGNGAYFASSNAATTNGYVNINGADQSEIFNYGYVNTLAQTGYVSGGSGTTGISLRTSNRAVIGGELDVVSDVRQKKEIELIDLDYCKRFVDTIEPKSFVYKNSERRTNGFIAQEIVKGNFPELIGVARDESVEELIDEDGFMSPAGQIFTLNAEGVIPILTKCVKDLYQENAELKAKIDEIMKKLDM